MTCKTISDANPDIAGIGIILAFGLQALISLLLSATARLLLSKHFPLTGRDRKEFWKEWLGTDHTIQNPWRDIRHAFKTVNAGEEEESKTKKVVNTVVQSIKKGIVDGIKDCVDPSLFPSGDDNHFIEKFGLGGIADFARRELTEGSSRNAIRANLSKEITKTQEKAQELICKVLLVASDAQTVTGIALIITAMVQQKSLSLYHLHIIYDTINFTTVSNIAAMSCVYDTQLQGKRVRYFSIGIFGLLYTGFTVMLGIRLNDWNDAIPGRCYRTSKIALPTAKHPLVDQIYLGFTSVYVYCLMVVAILLCRLPSTRLYFQKAVIITGTMQFVLHVYTLVALRISNQPLLDNVALEDEWGFGQVIALVMLVATLLECAKGLEEYLSWKKEEASSLEHGVEETPREPIIQP